MPEHGLPAFLYGLRRLFLPRILADIAALISVVIVAFLVATIFPIHSLVLGLPLLAIDIFLLVISLILNPA